MTPASPLRERERLDLILRGFQVSRMLRSVADLGIADRVPPDGGVLAAGLARECQVQAQPLLRMLRALASFGIFEIGVDGTVRHTASSRLLRTEHPHSLHYAARFWTSPGSWRAWGMLDAALTGGVPHDAAWSQSRFEYLRVHPEEARIFDDMMAHWPDDRHEAIAAAYDFSEARLICDLGGGNGETLRHILGQCPASLGLLFDRADVVDAVDPDGLMDGRITRASGSFFQSVPSGADIYLLVTVLHNWSDDDCVRILRSCRAGVGEHSLLLVADQILERDASRGTPENYLTDMQMMAMYGTARERTEEEFCELLERGGFQLRRTIPTRSPTISILEAATA